MAELDVSRALLVDSDIYPPFHVTATGTLAEALDCGAVRQHTPVLVVEHGSMVLVLLTRQLVFHHVAQGETEGEAWMVSF